MKLAFIAIAAVTTILASAAFMAVTVFDAEAHANLVESSPQANSRLPTAPNKVTLWFTETLEPQFSNIEVIDSEGERVDMEDSQVSDNDATAMSVSLKPLTNGTYTVVWKNVSTVDGHLVRGAFAFSVGEALAATAPIEVDQPLFQSWIEPFIRWLTLFGGCIAVGSMIFRLIVAAPVMASVQSEDAKNSAFSAALVTIRAPMGIFLTASMAHIILQASMVYDSSVIFTIFLRFMDLQRETSWGAMWQIRAFLIIGIFIIIYIMEVRQGDQRATRLLSIQAALGAGALLTISLSSHAAAIPDIAWYAIFNDFLHLMAVSVWMGGIFSLLGIFIAVFGKVEGEERRAIVSSLLSRFSVIAAMSVAVTIVTGMYSAWAQVTIPAALTVPYGITLLVKLAFVGALLAVAGVILFWLKPRMNRDEHGTRRIRKLIVAECMLAALIFLSVGFLVSLEPARQVASREGIGVENGFSFSETMDGIEVGVEVEPGAVGTNSVVVSLQDSGAEPITEVTDVRVKLSYLDQDLGETPLSAESVGDGRFALNDMFIGLEGAWQVDVVVQRPNDFDTRTAFRFETADVIKGGSLAIVPSQDTGRMLFGIEMIVLGVIFLGGGLPLGGWYTRLGLATMTPGALAVIAGAVILLVSTDTNSQIGIRNPVLPSSESVALGRELYDIHCQQCHGFSGQGDGPAGAALDPPPADLVVHVPLHPDRALFDFISEGIDGTAMVGLADTLSEEEIWHLINYIQTLE